MIFLSSWETKKKKDPKFNIFFGDNKLKEIRLNNIRDDAKKVSANRTKKIKPFFHPSCCKCHTLVRLPQMIVTIHLGN